jgi:hypothetical protein
MSLNGGASPVPHHGGLKALPKAAGASAPHLSRSQWLVLIAAFLGWMFDGVEQGVFPLVARPALQDLLGVEADKLLGPWMGYITTRRSSVTACVEPCASGRGSE